jgi:Tol biopolymer transport system component
VTRWLLRTLCVAALLLSSAVAGCGTARIPNSELPAQPIAITYWEPEAARRRAEIESKANEQQPRQREGVARLEHIGAMLGVYDPKQSASLARFPGHLALVDPRTGRVDKIDAATPGSRPVAWSSDRKRLLFLSAPEAGRNQLLEYDVETDLVSRLTSGDGATLAADYGPDRSLVYADVKREGRHYQMKLFVTGAFGASPRLLSDTIETDGLSWSPSGDLLLWVRRDLRGGRTTPTLMAREPVAGSEDRDLAPGRDPVFTADGEWVVYSGPVGDGWRLSRMRPDGSGRTRVGQGTRDQIQPAVSPDGEFIAYIGKDESDIGRLHLRRMDGTGDLRLITSGGASSPAW